MPAISLDADGRRLVNVGVISNAVAGESLDKNEIVSVHIPTATVVRYTTGAPPTSNAALLACGPATSGCSLRTRALQLLSNRVAGGEPGLEAERQAPELHGRRPRATARGSRSRTSIYRGRLILKRGDVPVLNVLYDGNVCGPFRDWLYSEDCFRPTERTCLRADRASRCRECAAVHVCARAVAMRGTSRGSRSTMRATPSGS